MKSELIKMSLKRKNKKNKLYFVIRQLLNLYTYFVDIKLRLITSGLKGLMSVDVDQHIH